MIHDERIQPLNARPTRDGRYVLYWMQASQRSRFNHALEHAIDEANRLGLPVVALFGITDNYPEANERHYAFMLEGLAQTRLDLEKRGVRFVVLHESPERAAVRLSDQAAMVVTDRGYLRIQREWRQHVAQQARCAVVQVESDAIVPIEVASEKEAFAARTLRPRIHRHLERFLVPLRPRRVKHPSLALKLEGLSDLEVDVSDADALLATLRIDRGVGRVTQFRGGRAEAERLLTAFVNRKLARYDEDRNDASIDGLSHMSPYLHFGQISPLEIALRVREADAPREAADVYLEELIVRRELSLNFVYYNDRYDSFEGLPPWARQTLRQHAGDARPVLYSREELERGRTGDTYWNAAQKEMLLTGKMHNYMRMYWGKKILEWTRTPEEAFDITLHLNNKYHLDGRDPNSFAGVAWVFGKHDRPWFEREIFGTVRYMNASGLERKMDIEAYVRKVEAMETNLFAERRAD